MAASTERPFPSFWMLHLGGWAALGLSMWVGVVVHVEDPGRAFVGKMIFAVIGGTLALALRPLYRWLHDRGTSVPRLIAVSAACSYAHSFVWSILYKGSTYLLWTWVDGEALTIPSLASLTGGVLFYTFIPMAWSVLYIGIKYYQDVQAERERALAAEGLAHEARLQALRYQVNPHFLFNTLNAISTLITERKNTDAERMVARLSDFLRLTLDQGTDAEVPLAEEMDFVRRYLSIQQIRFGDRLATTFDLDADTLSACVPPLLLQPLVENAVRHGIMPREDGGTVAVEARRVGDRLHLRVSDDGPGPPSAATVEASNGIGLTNVRERLKTLYGDDHRFRLDRADGGGCIVSVSVPFHTTPLPSEAVAEVPESGSSLPASTPPVPS
jgi:glucose-6-phosphate-specific signal transduction histidine kinase